MNDKTLKFDLPLSAFQTEIMLNVVLVNQAKILAAINKTSYEIEWAMILKDLEIHKNEIVKRYDESNEKEAGIL